jgi:hypothetical protein
MRPSEVRDLVAHDHLQIRILACEVDIACRRVLDGEEVDVAGPVLKIARVLWGHLALEDRILAPVLREIDGWGPVRADGMLAEHARQREELGILTRLARTGSAEEVARATQQLIAALRDDMDAEEQGLLSSELLHDDLVVIDQVDG